MSADRFLILIEQTHRQSKKEAATDKKTAAFKSRAAQLVSETEAARAADAKGVSFFSCSSIRGHRVRTEGWLSARCAARQVGTGF